MCVTLPPRECLRYLEGAVIGSTNCSLNSSTAWLPTSEQTLLLQAALLEGEPAEHALRQWRARVNLDDLDRGSYRLLPLLYRAIRQRAKDHPDLKRLRATYVASLYLNTTLLAGSTKVLTRLDELGIPHLVLKGAALQHLAYAGDSATRPFSDLDILVRRGHAEAALRALKDLGFRTEAKLVFGPGQLASYAGMNFVRGLSEQIDLHWRLSHFSRDSGFEDRAWTRAAPLVLAGVKTQTLDPTDHLLHTLCHGAEFNEVPTCRWAADATLLLRGGPINWDRLLDDTAHMGFLPPVIDGLAYLATKLRAPVPAEVLARLERTRPPLLDRLQHWARVSPPSRRSMATRLFVSDYRARTGGQPMSARVTGYPRYLVQTLNAEGTRSPVTALGAAVRVLQRGTRTAI